MRFWLYQCDICAWQNSLRVKLQTSVEVIKKVPLRIIKSVLKSQILSVKVIKKVPLRIIRSVLKSQILFVHLPELILENMDMRVV